MKKIVLILLAGFAFVFLLSGCHTMHGLGEDISSGGQALSRAASRDDHSKKKNSQQKNSKTTTKKKKKDS